MSSIETSFPKEKYPDYISTASFSSGAARPKVEGKFLTLGHEKFFVRGVTYGAFPPNRLGHQFPEPVQVARDFTLMRRAGINTILTYTVPPISLLDKAQEHGIRVIVTVPWSLNSPPP